MECALNKKQTLERIHNEWLCMIMRGDTAEETLATCEALIEGGAKLIEVAFTTPNVVDVIRKLSNTYGDDIVLSVGTVRTVEQARMAIEAGARGIVSPDFYAPVVETAVAAGVVSAPGCATPSEIGGALRLGADIIKLFPCYPVGPDYIRYINGPFPEAKIMPAGKVTLDNMPEYAAAGAFAVVVGVTTEMQMRAAITAGRYDEVTAAARHWLARAHEL